MVATINLSGVLCGVIAGHTLLVYLPVHQTARGYLLRAAVRSLFFTTVWVIVQFAVGVVICFGVTIPMPKIVGLAASVVVGFLTVAFPRSIEALLGFLIGGRPNTRHARKVARVFAKLQLAIKRHLLYEVQCLLIEDNESWQQGRGEWNIDEGGGHLSPSEAGRRIRRIYEIHKLDISNKNGNHSLLDFDIGVHPGQKFYLLARYLGRRQLHRSLQSTHPEFAPNWSGQERRRERQIPPPFARRIGDQDLVLQRT
jgi:hypothetical protein